MRILVVTVVHHPLDARVFSRQIGIIRERGHQVVYAAPWSATGTEPPRGFDAIDLPRSIGRSRLRAIRAAREAMSTHGPAADLILIHDPELVPAVPRPLRAKTVWDVHEDVPATLIDKAWLPAPMRPVAREVVKHIESWAEQHMRLMLAEAAYEARFRERHPIVPNDPLVPEGFDRSVDSKVVHLGRHSRGRGALELAAVARDLPDSVRFILAGPADEDVAATMSGVAQRPNVEWTGRIPNEEGLVLVKRSLVGLSLLHDLPNYRRSRPTKIVEYMSRGVPVISTPLPVAVDIIEHYGCGFIVPFGDAGAVVDAITDLASDPERRAEMGKRGYDAAYSHFNWAKTGLAFVQHLEEWALITG